MINLNDENTNFPLKNFSNFRIDVVTTNIWKKKV